MIEKTETIMDAELDEDDRLRRDIAREVEKGFATVAYPGDDNLFRYPDDYPSAFLRATFKGKHWRDITPEMLIEHQHQLSYFSPEAFRFFLPCFLICALLHGDVTEFLWETVYYNLAPGHRDMAFLNDLINLLDARQKAVLRRYIELYLRIEVTVPDPHGNEALEFWRRVAKAEENSAVHR